MAATASGSSPLARGTPESYPFIAQDWGLIPARAGNTTIVRRRFHLPGAHPRSRGEHLDEFNSQLTLEGSSPLARGTHVHQIWSRFRAGLIPARAGNTNCSLTACPLRGAHPRSRGEHLSSAMGELAGWGSSPLARGTLHHRWRQHY